MSTFFSSIFDNIGEPFLNEVRCIKKHKVPIGPTPSFPFLSPPFIPPPFIPPPFIPPPFNPPPFFIHRPEIPPLQEYQRGNEEGIYGDKQNGNLEFKPFDGNKHDTELSRLSRMLKYNCLNI